MSQNSRRRERESVPAPGTPLRHSELGGKSGPSWEDSKGRIKLAKHYSGGNRTGHIDTKRKVREDVAPEKNIDLVFVRVAQHYACALPKALHLRADRLAV